MNFTLQKRRTILIIVGSIISIFLIVFFLSSFWQTLYTKKVIDDFEKYLLDDFTVTKLDESGSGALHDLYLYTYIEEKIEGIRLAKDGVIDVFSHRDPERYESYAKETRPIFLKQCEMSPEACHPLWAIMPYCMSRWAESLMQDHNVDVLEFKEQVSEDRVLVRLLNYWRNYLDKKDWNEEDLSAVLGFVVSENLCGDIQNIDAKDWSERTIRVGIETTDPSKKMRHIFEKMRIIINLHDRAENISQIPPYEGLEEICVILQEKIILIGGACDMIYYYRNRRFCMEEPEVEHKRIRQYLKERSSNPEEVLCQIGLREWARNYFYFFGF